MGSYTNYYEASKLFHGCLMIVMGTRLDVLLIGQPEQFSRQVWEEIENEAIRLDKMLSKYDQESELSAINRTAFYSPVFVKEELWAILWECKRYCKLTLGYFDISLGNLNEVFLDKTNQTVRFNKESIELDLSGFAKGYLLEKVRTHFLDRNMTQAFINFGNSSIMALGNHPHGKNWVVGITDPYLPNKTLRNMELKDCSMSTSGNMPNHQKHIINPHTGIYSQDRKLVSVVARNAIDAEVLSTALMVADKTELQNILYNFNTIDYQIFNF